MGVAAYDVNTSANLWRARSHWPVHTQALATSCGANGTVVLVALGHARTNILALCAKSGELLWSAQFQTQINDMVSVGCTTYMSGEDRSAFALDSATGVQLWAADPGCARDKLIFVN